ncbi:Uncharacterised protein [Staphylococcus aureus]|nr:Uncharacterised protein [Staphylococcus aureus]SGQ94255.1 Uncharacterised protein [Staphylococcus aureus]SGS43111.1 Uncharacterised protein [Staphylococcus aureus]SGT15728.1 Uncharacterised protein [Staphylococcus aureus]SGU28702.1 Uncharacterised protein [Staphylococcus aureus]
MYLFIDKLYHNYISAYFMEGISGMAINKRRGLKGLQQNVMIL